MKVKVDKDMDIVLEKCPHVLVCGSTGSGKSYLMKNMLSDILESDEARVLVIDPKCVDYQFLVNGKGCDGFGRSESELIKRKWLKLGFNLLTYDDIESGRVLAYLCELENEMRSRYSFMMSRGYVEWSEVSSDEYESVWGSKRIVIVVDELADLMYANRRTFDWVFIKLATLGRAAGIHLLLGTQRPDATVLSGQLRANVDCRIGLGMVNNMERRIVLGDSCKEYGNRVMRYCGEYSNIGWV